MEAAGAPLAPDGAARELRVLTTGTAGGPSLLQGTVMLQPGQLRRLMAGQAATEHPDQVLKRKVMLVSAAIALYIAFSAMIQSFCNLAATEMLRQKLQSFDDINQDPHVAGIINSLPTMVLANSFHSIVFAIATGMLFTLCGCLATKGNNTCCAGCFCCCTGCHLGMGCLAFFGMLIFMFWLSAVDTGLQVWLQNCDPIEACGRNGTATDREHMVDCLAAGMWRDYQPHFGERMPHNCPPLFLECGGTRAALLAADGGAEPLPPAYLDDGLEGQRQGGPQTVKVTRRPLPVESILAGCSEVPPPLQHLREHPAVEHCELVGGAAYVVRRAGSKGAAPLGGGVEDWDWELEEYVKARMIVGGSSASAAPRVRFADRLPEPPSGLRAPFGLLHALDALFADADADGSGEVSLEDFVSFCRRTGLFSSSESEAREVFLKSRSQPSASEILFRGNDLFDMDMGAEAHNKIKFYDFQKLVLDAGIVEVTSGHDHVRFFVDERAVDVILRRWLAMYDSSKQGALRFEDYVSLIADYRMPLCSSAEAYDSLARRRAPEGAAAAAPGAEAGLRLEHLRFVLEQGGVLETGASVEAEDELGKQWRDMKDSQSFLPPAGRVFVADGRDRRRKQC
ncbi:unnamed protein product [Prorocentrum cordatum]|uniref:EF-hand domain-containing protein n=1 Tax=Prorocentrum cordatum TaxID=2364126 RepID=A0ABN9S763_9DINO|nr:unnamed protein product [Polarella glacialis]